MRLEQLITRRGDILLDAEWGWGEHEVLVTGVSATQGIRYVTWGQEWWLPWNEAREGVIAEVSTVKVLSAPEPSSPNAALVVRHDGNAGQPVLSSEPAERL
jgi:hypothetical protein